MKHNYFVSRMILVVILLSLTFATAQAAGIPPSGNITLLKDISTPNRGSSPNYFFGFEDSFSFSATTVSLSKPLWTSNGIPGDQKILFDGLATYLGQVGQTGYFVSTVDRRRLFKTDGTPQGTSLFYEFPAGKFVSERGTIQAGDWLYFLVYVDGWGELWRTDGSEANTTAMAPTLRLPGIYAESSPHLIYFKNALYFSAREIISPCLKLMRIPQANSITPGQPEIVKEINEMNCTDGWPRRFAATNNLLFFVIYGQTTGEELWVTDGTGDGTIMVRDINPGIDGSSPRYLTALGNLVYFAANDGSHGIELWQSGGTFQTTKLVKDIYLGASSSSPHHLVPMNGAMYYAAENATNGVELWKTEGIITDLLEICPGICSGDPQEMMAMNGSLYFSAQNQANDLELWRTDGTAVSTSRVMDVVPGSGGSSPQLLAVWKGRIIFSALDPLAGCELWLSDGTPQNTFMLDDIDIASDTYYSIPVNFRTLNGITYFLAADAWHGRELWRSDGTSQGTWRVFETIPGPEFGNVSMESMVSLNGITYFAATDSNGVYEPFLVGSQQYGMELWRTDGTSQGTWMVKDIYPGPNAGFSGYMTGWIVKGGKIFFIANDGVHGDTLWSSDGTAAGTTMVSPSIPLSPYALSILSPDGYMLYVSMHSPGFGDFKLVRSDGTTAGTTVIYSKNFYNTVNPLFVKAMGDHVYVGLASYMDVDNYILRINVKNGVVEELESVVEGKQLFISENAVVLSDSLYFVARIKTGAEKNLSALWKLTSQSSLPEKIYVLPEEYFIRNMVVFDQNRFMFSVNNGFGLERWYISDGTVQGTNELCQTCVYNYKYGVTFTVWQGLFFFVADAGSGNEIWFSDGTSGGTLPLKSIYPALTLSDPNQLTGIGIHLFFSANDGISGREPWVYTIDLPEKVYLPSIGK